MGVGGAITHTGLAVVDEPDGLAEGDVDWLGVGACVWPLGHGEGEPAAVAGPVAATHDRAASAPATRHTSTLRRWLEKECSVDMTGEAYVTKPRRPGGYTPERRRL